MKKPFVKKRLQDMTPEEHEHVMLLAAQGMAEDQAIIIAKADAIEAGEKTI